MKSDLQPNFHRLKFSGGMALLLLWWSQWCLGEYTPGKTISQRFIILKSIIANNTPTQRYNALMFLTTKPSREGVDFALPTGHKLIFMFSSRAEVSFKKT